MTEAELLAEVTGLCEQLGLLWHHCAASARCQGQRGFPDLVIAGPGGVIFAELKSADGDTTAEQDRWIWTLDRALDVPYSGLVATLWRPADLPRIRGELEQLTG